MVSREFSETTFWSENVNSVYKPNQKRGEMSEQDKEKHYTRNQACDHLLEDVLTIQDT